MDLAVLITAFVWGFAEASLFFIVPDVLLTLIAIRSGLRRALAASLSAAAGAIAGGAVMANWGLSDLENAREILDRVPAISPALIATVGEDLRSQGALALFFGSVTGVPYKIFAVESAPTGMSILSFIAWSLPARLLRFVGAALLAWCAAELLRKRGWSGVAFRLWAGFWILFYALYFYLVPG